MNVRPVGDAGTLVRGRRQRVRNATRLWSKRATAKRRKQQMIPSRHPATPSITESLTTSEIAAPARFAVPPASDESACGNVADTSDEEARGVEDSAS